MDFTLPPDEPHETRGPVAWLSRLAAVAVVFALVWYYRPSHARIERQSCRQRYAGARSAADTAAIDTERVIVGHPVGEVSERTCGQMRKSPV